MITVHLESGEKVVVKPRSLHNYIEKVDYIKGRRPSPYSSLRDLPKMNADAKKVFIEIAMMASMKMSAISIMEEMEFDSSLEGFYYGVWQSMKTHMKWPDDGEEGVDTARKWFVELTDDDKSQVRLAMSGVDERKLAKNSDGPEENPQKGPEPQLAAAG